MRDVPTIVKCPTLYWTVTNKTKREALVHEYVPVMVATPVVGLNVPTGSTVKSSVGSCV